MGLVGRVSPTLSGHALLVEALHIFRDLIEIVLDGENGRNSAGASQAFLIRALLRQPLAHPTMAEGLSSLFSNVPPRAERRAMSKVA